MLNQWDWSLYKFGMSVQGKLEGMKLTRFNGQEIPDFLSKAPLAGLDKDLGFPKRCTIIYELHQKPEQPLTSPEIVDTYTDADWPEYAVLNGSIGNWIPNEILKDGNGDYGDWFIGGLPHFNYYGNQFIQGWFFADSKDRTWWVAPKLNYDRPARTLTVDLEAQLFGIISDKTLPDNKIELHYQKQTFTFPVDCMAQNSFLWHGMPECPRWHEVSPPDWMAFIWWMKSYFEYDNPDENPWWRWGLRTAEDYFDFWAATYGDISKHGEKATIAIRGRPLNLFNGGGDGNGSMRDVGIWPHRGYILHGWYELEITEIDDILDIKLETISTQAFKNWVEDWGMRAEGANDDPSDPGRTVRVNEQLFHVMYDANDTRIEMVFLTDEETVAKYQDNVEIGWVRVRGTSKLLRNNVELLRYTYTTDETSSAYNAGVDAPGHPSSGYDGTTSGVVTSSLTGEVWRGNGIMQSLAAAASYAIPCIVLSGSQSHEVGSLNMGSRTSCTGSAVSVAVEPMPSHVRLDTDNAVRHIIGVEVLGNKLIGIVESLNLRSYGGTGDIVYPAGEDHYVAVSKPVENALPFMGDYNIYFPKKYAGVVTPEGDILPYNPTVEFERITVLDEPVTKYDPLTVTLRSKSFDRQKITQSVRWHPVRRELIYMDDDGDAESLQII